MTEITEAIRSIPVIAQASEALECEADVVAWVDDLTVPFAVHDAAALDDALQQVAQLLQQACDRRGLALNYQKGKTEAMCQYRGQGSDACRQRRFVDCAGLLDLVNGRTVHITAQYQHLGTRVTEAGGIEAEIKARIDKATVSVHTISKGIL